MIELDNVIVTALGIEKKENSLSYATDLIKNEELTRVKMPNLITSLTGKSAGVRVNQVSSGLGASAKVSIRGIRSVASDNQPAVCDRRCSHSELQLPSKHTLP